MLHKSVCNDDVATEFVGHDLLNMDFEEMAAIQDDVLEVNVENRHIFSQLGKKLKFCSKRKQSLCNYSHSSPWRFQPQVHPCKLYFWWR